MSAIFGEIEMEKHVDGARLSRFGEEGPIVVVLSSIDAKMEVIKNAKKLQNGAFKSVYINHDRTKMDVDREKELRKEQRSLNDVLTKGTRYEKHE